MTRISPVLVLLLAAGCAQAGISDWLNPFRMFGGKPPRGGDQSSVAGGAQHSTGAQGHRGPRQLNYPGSGPGSLGPHHGGHHGGPSAQSSGPLGSPPGHLDDGFKPSFPPGFANPPSHSPNLNPFATTGSHGGSGGPKGPLPPSQLTLQHSPGSASASGSSYSPLRPRGRFGFRGRAPPAQPHHAASSPVGHGNGHENGPEGTPIDYAEFNRLANQGGDYDEGQGSGPAGPIPQGAPQGPRGPPRGFRPGGRPLGRPQGPPPSYNQESGRPGGPSGAFGGRPFQGGPGGPQGGPGGPGGPYGGPGGPGGPSHLESGPESGLFGGGRPGPYSGGPPGGRPGSDAPFFASSPGQGGPSPFSGQGGPGQGGPSPFGGQGGPGPQSSYSSGGPQSSGPFGSGGPSSLFGNEDGPRGPPQQGSGGPGGFGGPQSLFAPGNDYPEQFEGGSRETREPHLSPADFRPQPNGPPDGAPEEQNSGFYGALHNTGGGQGGQDGPSSNFFNQQDGPSSLDGPNSPSSPFGGPQGSLYGGQAQQQPQHAPQGYSQQRPRKPPVRLGIRNTLANVFGGGHHHGASSSMQQYQGVPLMMSASGAKPAIALPVPKGGRGLPRPFVRKPGVVVPLSSPKDPNYRPPMRFSPSNISPVTANFEPDTAASGGLHGGYGDVGLTHNGDRILYHVAGHQGPYSYRFGFDTGKGYNRIFRFEEKDGKGEVKGKYGFYDKSGKLNIINYQAHPKHGYHAERGHSHGLY